MRNLKKFLALVLAMIMIVSASAVVSADFTDVAADDRYAAAINDLAVKGIVKGTSDTTFAPANDVTREQMALFVARAITGEVESDDIWANGIVPFVDVTDYKGAIQCAYLNGIINGTSATTFEPKGGITYVAALKMAVCALGYGEGLEWPWGYYNKAAELGLTANMDIDTLEAELNRAETAQIIYNMIYAAPANGGKTFAAANFSIAAPENTTLFAITATPKQYYYTEAGAGEYNSAADVEGTYVGLQTLVNGVPSGKMLYTAVENIGLDKKTVENYFNYAVELINFDAATGTFDRAEIVGEPVVITNKDVTYAANNNKIVYNNTTYTAVDAFTGASLINEMVVYDGTGVSSTAKMLLTDKNGDIISVGENGVTVVALFAYESSTGAKYYYDGADSKKVISEAQALTQYGVYVDDAENPDYIEYNTLTTAEGEIAANLYKNAYELKLFDDDRDGKYERAFYAPIYVGTYDAYYMGYGDPNGNGYKQKGTIDAMVAAATDTYVAAEDVTYSDVAAKDPGTVMVFTYNKQLKQVNVIEVLEMQTGVVEEIDVRKELYLTVDGKRFTMAQNTADDKVAVGANFAIYGIAGGVEDIANNPFFQLIAGGSASAIRTWAKENLLIDKDPTIGFYAYNDYILYASVLPEASAVINLAIVDDFAGFNLNEIYLDMYVDGELVGEALVTDILGKDLSTLSDYKFSMVLSKKEYYYPGTIYAVTVDEDAYNLKAVVDNDNFEDYGLINAKVASEDAVDGVGSIKFNDGYSENEDRALRIRTGASTVFYFIQPGECTCEQEEHDEECASVDPYEVTISIFKGQPDDADIFFDENTSIWVDALGYGSNKTNGRATEIYVINPVDTAGFFGITDTSYVYVSSVKNYLKNSAARFELPEEYTGYYYKYPSAALNLDDASIVSIYSKEPISGGHYYKVDENGVVVKMADDVITEATATRDFIKYGIGNFNGYDTTLTSNRWGSYWDKDWATMTVDIYDYIWATDPDTIRKGRLEPKQEELAAALMDVIAGNTTIADHNVLGGAEFSAQAYIDWFKAEGLDEIEFLDIPDTIDGITLVDPIVYAEYNDDGYLTIEVLRDGFAGLELGDYLLDQEDHIKDIVVVKRDLSKKWTGEDAIEILNNSPRISLVGAVDAGDADNAYLVEDLFKELLVDGTIVFLCQQG